MFPPEINLPLLAVCVVGALVALSMIVGAAIVFSVDAPRIRRARR